MTVGRKEDVLVDGHRLTDLVWADSPVGGSLLVQGSAHGPVLPATLHGDVLVWDTPQPRIAPGQSVAFYEGDEVLGGALVA